MLNDQMLLYPRQVTTIYDCSLDSRLRVAEEAPDPHKTAVAVGGRYRRCVWGSYVARSRQRVSKDVCGKKGKTFIGQSPRFRQRYADYAYICTQASDLSAACRS